MASIGAAITKFYLSHAAKSGGNLPFLPKQIGAAIVIIAAPIAVSRESHYRIEMNEFFKNPFSNNSCRPIPV